VPPADEPSASPTDVVVRPATEADHAEMRIVLERAIAITGTARYTPAQVRAWVGTGGADAEWSSRLAALAAWVAEDGAALAGFVGLDAEGHVDLLFVDPDHGRRGVARALLDVAVARARDDGHARVTTDASLVAEPVFARQGFVAVRRQRVTRGDEVLENVRMALTLAPPPA
jgi:putative acetyltransferase